LKVSELEKGEKFVYAKREWTRLRRLKKANNEKWPYDIYDCMDEDGRHRPFRDDVEVEPKQRRIEKW